MLIFVAPATEERILTRIAGHVRPGGYVVTGFSLGRGYALAELDSHARAAGLALRNRFSTWDLAPHSATDDYAVSVFVRVTESTPETPAETT